MEKFDYTFAFDDIGNDGGRFKMDDRRSGQCHNAKIMVHDQQLTSRKRSWIPPEVADLIDLAAAVYTADRLVIRHENLAARIHIVLPLRNPVHPDCSLLKESLEQILFWFTEDIWTFEFRNRTALARQSEIQSTLSFGEDSHLPVEVALWSGGLDSLAGLSTRLMTNLSSRFILFGTGGNTFIHGRQKEVAHQIDYKFCGRTTLIQVLLQLLDAAQLAKNSAPRARGFVFLLLGAVCAFLQNQSVLNTYENGVGAINLPFLPSELGLDHSRAVHPRSLIDMGTLVSNWFGTPFEFRNPFIYWTKGQMCEGLKHENLLDIAFRTSSCDRRFRKHERPIQCGCCSSCLLRRQAFAALGIQDQTEYVVTHVSKDVRPPQKSDGDHIIAMLYQANRFEQRLKENDPWAAVTSEYSDLAPVPGTLAGEDPESSENAKKHLLEMYGRYAQEWSLARPIVIQGLLEH